MKKKLTDDIIKMLRDAGEPVAWQSILGPKGEWTHDEYASDPEFRRKSEALGAKFRPLYLHPLEVTALLNEFLTREQSFSEEAYVPPYVADAPGDDDWTPVDGSPLRPVPEDTIIYVLYSDNEIGGPNRADAFLWGEPEILAYAVAKNAEPMPAAPHGTGEGRP